MIISSVSVDGNSVNTHRDSYLLSSLSVVSVRRPFLGGAILLGGSFLGFGGVFIDLLYPMEIIMISTLSILAIFAGAQIGELKLLSRDLRGSELSGVIWGQYSDLNQVRTKIVKQLSPKMIGEKS
jgi:hypothetical protein